VAVATISVLPVPAAAAGHTERPATPYMPIFNTATGTTVTLDLKHNGDNVGVVGAKIYRNTSEAGDIAVSVGEDIVFTFVDTGLGPSTEYWYWLKVYDGDGNLSYRSGGQQVFTTILDVVRPYTPYMPALDTATSSEVNLDLKHNDDNVGVTGAKIYRNTSNNFASATEVGDIAVSVGEDTIFAFKDESVNDNTTYWYWLKVYDGDGNLSYRSGGQQVFTPILDIAKPTTPYKPIFNTATATTVSLNLKHKGDNVGVTGAKIYRNTSNNFASATEAGDIAVTVPKETVFNFTDSGLAANTEYWYWLKVYDAEANLSSRSGGPSSLHVGDREVRH